MGSIEIAAVAGVLVGTLVIFLSLVLIAIGGEKRTAFLFSSGAIILVISCIVGPIANAYEEKPTKSKSVKIENKYTTIEECEADRFCEVEEINALRICNSNGCKIVEDTIRVIKSTDF